MKLVVVVRWSGGARGGMVEENKLAVEGFGIYTVVYSVEWCQAVGAKPGWPCFLRYYKPHHGSKSCLAEIRHCYICQASGRRSNSVVSPAERKLSREPRSSCYGAKAKR